MIYVAVFILCVALDMLAVYWTLAVVQRDPWRASGASLVIASFNVLGVLALLTSPIIAVAIVLGHSTGSWLAVWKSSE